MPSTSIPQQVDNDIRQLLLVALMKSILAIKVANPALSVDEVRLASISYLTSLLRGDSGN
jgi:hypothetical protein